MRKLHFILLASLILVACGEKPLKDHVKVSFQLKNDTTKTVTLLGRGVTKKIELKNGMFTDTLKVNTPGYFTFFGSQPGNRGVVFLKNGFNLKISSDRDTIIDGLSFKGFGENDNNFLAENIQYTKKLGDLRNLFSFEESVFNEKITQIENDLTAIQNSYSDLDSLIDSNSKTQLKNMMDFLKKSYVQQAKFRSGNPSPSFEKYKDYKGGTKSLADFKGKYVYIDMWATWCKPCITEIPHLKSLEKEYHGKNIEFVSISTDSDRRSGTWEKAEEKWRAMVKDKNLGGVQLFAGEDYTFAQEYQVTGIPRFILIDPNGNIVNAHAPRPSDPQLKLLFKELGI